MSHPIDPDIADDDLERLVQIKKDFLSLMQDVGRRGIPQSELELGAARIEAILNDLLRDVWNTNRAASGKLEWTVEIPSFFKSYFVRPATNPATLLSTGQLGGSDE